MDTALNLSMSAWLRSSCSDASYLPSPRREVGHWLSFVESGRGKVESRGGQGDGVDGGRGWKGWWVGGGGCSQ